MRPEELLQPIHDLIEQHNHEFGFQYLRIGDGNLIAAYPAALVLAGSVQRSLHGTHYFLTTLNAELVVMHANMDQNKMQRTLADLQLVTAVVALIHSKGLTFMDERIHRSFVIAEEPSTVSTENLSAVGTSLTIQAEVREAFK